MANAKRRLAGNVAGPFYVDDTCIDCGTCRWLAPGVFGDGVDSALVVAQPDTRGHNRAVMAAAVCPVAAIGTGDGAEVRAAAASLPEPVAGGVAGGAEGVYYMGFHSRHTVGGSSWLVVRDGGNVLVDCPRYSEALAQRIEALGPVQYLFLSHRDDVHGHDRWARRLGAARILHAGDLTDATRDVEHPISGTEPMDLAPDLTLIPVPGHTVGSMCLLFDGRALFTGDHLAFDRDRTRLIAYDRFCWHDWRAQTASMERLQDYSFSWVFPAHGAPGMRPAVQMRREMTRLLAWMQGVAA